MSDMTEIPVERATAMRDRIARLEQHARDAEQALRDADYLLLAIWKEGRAAATALASAGGAEGTSDGN